MRKEQKRLSIALAALLHLALVVPVTVSAYGQIDGLFSNEEDVCHRSGVSTEVDNTSGVWGAGTPTDYENGGEMPLGSGLMLFVAVAGLYLMARTLSSHKTTAMVLAATVAMTLGMTQCRKPIYEMATGETVSIKFNAGNGGSRANINVDDGLITWDHGDRVFVVCNNLVPSSTSLLLGDNLVAETDGVTSTISGTVTLPVGYTLPTNPMFVFYYVGKGVSFSPSAGATSLVFNIGSQNGADANDAGEYMIGRTDPVEMELHEGNYRPKEHPEASRAFLPLTAALRLDVNNIGTAGSDVILHAVSKVYNKMTISLDNPSTPSYTKGDITFKVGGDARISVMPAECTSSYDTVNLNFYHSTGRWGRVGIFHGINAGRIYVKIIDNTSNPIPVPLYATGTGEALTNQFNGGGWDGDDPGTGNGNTNDFGGENWGNP